jgi:hypothetical protein
MKKRVSCITPSLKTHRPVLRDISNQKPTEGQLLALEYNKNRLATLKEQRNLEASKRLEADAKRLEAENELKAEATKRLEADAKRLEAENELKKKDDELAQLRAMMAEMQGKK